MATFRQNKGLTLIELLLGLSIFSVMAVSLCLVFHNGVMISRRAQEQSGQDWQTYFALEMIARDLESMVQYTNTVSGEGGLKGTESEVSMIVSAGDGLKEVRYFLIAPEQSVIYRTEVNRDGAWRSAFQKKGSQAQGRAMTLVREASDFPCLERPCKGGGASQEILSFWVIEGGLKFMYAAGVAEDQTEDLKWEPRWEEAALPLGVAVNIQFIDADGNSTYTMSKRILIPAGNFSGASKHEI